MKDVYKILILRFFIIVFLLIGIDMCAIYYPIQLIVPLSLASMTKNLTFNDYFYGIIQICTNYFISILTFIFIWLLWDISKYMDQNKIYSNEGLKIILISTIMIFIISIIYTLSSLYFYYNEYVIVVWKYQGSFIIGGFIITIILLINYIIIKNKIKIYEK